MEDETYKNIFESRQVTVDYMKGGDDYDTQSEYDVLTKKNMFPSINIDSGTIIKEEDKSRSRNLNIRAISQSFAENHRHGPGKR